MLPGQDDSCLHWSISCAHGYRFWLNRILVPRAPVSFGHVIGETEGTNNTSSSGDENGGNTFVFKYTNTFVFKYTKQKNPPKITSLIPSHSVT